MQFFIIIIILLPIMDSNYSQYKNELQTILDFQRNLVDDKKNLDYFINTWDYKIEFPFYFRWPHGETILHWACVANNFEVVKYLLDNGSYVNASNNYGANPLFYAVKTNASNELISLLLENGADPLQLSTFSNKNSVDISENSDSHELIAQYAFNINNNCKSQRSILLNARERYECNWRQTEPLFGEIDNDSIWGYFNKDEELSNLIKLEQNFIKSLNLVENIEEEKGAESFPYSEEFVPKYSGSDALDLLVLHKDIDESVWYLIKSIPPSYKFNNIVPFISSIVGVKKNKLKINSINFGEEITDLSINKLKDEYIIIENL